MQQSHDIKTLESFCTCDLPNNFFNAATEENFQTYQRKSNHGRKLVLIVINAVQLLVQ